MHATPVAIVTGASRGIGRAIAEKLSRTHAVIINYNASRSEAETLQCAITARGGEALAVQANVAEQQERERLVRTAIESFGRIDVLINNAGISVPKRLDLLEVDQDAWESVLRVNLEAPFFLSQLVAREMIRLREQGCIERGTIVNISSISAFAVSLNRAPYCVAKAALDMVTKLFAVRLAPFSIAVFEIRPGIIRTDMTAPAQARYEEMIAQGVFPMARWGTPEDVACAVELLCSGQLTYATGDAIHVDGGFHIRRL